MHICALARASLGHGCGMRLSRAQVMVLSSGMVGVDSLTGSVKVFDCICLGPG